MVLGNSNHEGHAWTAALSTMIWRQQEQGSADKGMEGAAGKPRRRPWPLARDMMDDAKMRSGGSSKREVIGRWLEVGG